MPPAVALGVGLGGSAIAGGFGAIEAGNAAKNARRAAEAQFQFAQQFRPELFQPSTDQQSNLYNQLLSNAGGIQQFSPQQEAAARQSLLAELNKGQEQNRQRVVESGAARGLFRSGIGAQQERQFLGESQGNINDALLNQQLQFAQQRNQAAVQRQQALGGLAAYQQQQLGGQFDLYSLLSGQAQQGAAAAAQARTGASQALGQAIGGPFQALGTYGLLGQYGGLPGGGNVGIGTPQYNPYGVRT